jgi:hypothetical protein
MAARPSIAMNCNFRAIGASMDARAANFTRELEQPGHRVQQTKINENKRNGGTLD